MTFLHKNRFVFSAFFIAFGIMTLAFAKEGMYPFGNNQIMIIDSWHQYFPILQELHYKLQHFDSLFYTWQSGMGTNFLVMIGYYAMSPLNLLSIFVPAAFLREFMLFATIFKISLAGSTFAIYIRALYGRNDISILIFGLFYAFSGFLMGYYWDIMWLDAVALLPLVILGLHRLMDTGKWYLFTITLAITLISNFYTAYFVCIFVAFYFFVLFSQKSQGKNFKDFVIQIAKVGAASIVGIGLSAVTLLPIVYGMSRAYGLKSGNPTTLTTYHAIIDILNNLLANIKPTIVDGLPNIQSGMLPLLFCLIYFVTKSIPMRNRISNGILMGFLILSMNLNILNFFWHGFHFPNQVPFRFSFLLSFMLITVAYEAFSHLKEIEPKTIQTFAFGFIVYLLISEKLYKETFDFKVFYVSILYIALYTVVLMAWLNKRITSSLFMIFLLCLGLTEYGLSAFKATDTAGNSGRADYPTQNTAVQKALSDLRNLDSSFYRTEMYPLYSANDPILYQYPGITQFSSTANSKINYFLKDFGVSADPGSNSVKYLPTPPAVSGMLNIKYMLSKHNGIPLPNAAYTEVGKYDGLTLLKHNYPMPMGIVAENAIEAFDISNDNPFLVQTSYIKEVLGKDISIYQPISLTSETYTNIERTNLEQDIRYNYRNINASQVGRATIGFVAPDSGQYYAYMLNGSKEVTLTVNGNSRVYETPRGVLMDLGHLEVNSPINFDFELAAQSTGFFDIALVKLDVSNYESVYNELISNRLDVASHDDTKIEGLVTTSKPGQLILSIPFDPGWKAELNGMDVQPTPLKDGLMMIPVSAGTHMLKLRFVPQGFTTGLIIMVISLIIMIVYQFIYRRFNLKSS